jgi:hypothetical protein
MLYIIELILHQFDSFLATFPVKKQSIQMALEVERYMVYNINNNKLYHQENQEENKF